MTTYSTDPALYIFTSLTAGSSHIITATSRLEMILRANRIPFKAVDMAIDPKARMLWGRRAGTDETGRKRVLPGLAQEGTILGDFKEIEDWNEYGELKQHVKIYYDEHTIPSINNKPPDPPKPVFRKPAAKASSATSSTPTAPTPPPAPLPKTTASAATKEDKSEAGKPAQAAIPIRSMAEEAAQKAKELRLRSLREKVHGKKPAAATAGTAAEPRHSDSSNASEVPGMQSSATSAWIAVDSTRGETQQSPTSGKWQQEAEDSTAAAAVPADVMPAEASESKAEEPQIAATKEPEKKQEEKHEGVESDKDESEDESEENSEDDDDDDDDEDKKTDG